MNFPNRSCPESYVHISFEMSDAKRYFNVTLRILKYDFYDINGEFSDILMEAT